MANGNGKDSPFNSDGKSGAVGNSGGGGGPMTQGMKDQRGPDRPQRMGNNGFNPDSVAPGGRQPAFDPPGDREGLVGQTAKGGMLKSGPMKIGTGPGGKRSALAGSGESQHGTEEGDASPSEGGPVGDIPNTDQGE